jgi:hypothetical protein
MKTIGIIILTLFLSSCTSPSRNASMPSNIMMEGMRIFGDSNFIYTEVRSYGEIPDLIGIGVNKGSKSTKNAEGLRNVLSSLSKSNGRIIINGSNPILTRTDIELALNTDQNFQGVWLVYAGTKRNSEILKPIVEAKGMKYGFINNCDTVASLNIKCAY